jgi:hypothetical protein
LGLDARGVWRMRDERAQHLGLAGDKVVQAKLLGFINRNYAADERGCWFFQNGPQRVYVQLEATPFIARTDPQLGLVLHTGAPVDRLERAVMTEAGELIVQAGSEVAQVDDRDLAQLMPSFEIDGQVASDEALMAWLDGADSVLALRYRDAHLVVARIRREDVASDFGFVRTPVQ